MSTHSLQLVPQDHTTADSSPRLRALVPGMLVAGRYRVERRVAAGGMGEVWEGEHGELRLRVALKTLRKEMLGNHEILARFSREAFLLGRIQSDHVARVFDFVADPQIGPILVTEFVEGPSLASVVESRRLTIEEAIELGIDIVTGVRELHRAHVIHRDVKPANILLRPIGDGKHRAVFVDFGVSRLMPSGQRAEQQLTEITTCDRALGTIEYMAPEQILSSRDATAAADLYGVGAILYRAVAGRHAFGATKGIELLKRKLGEAAPPLDTGRSDRVAKGYEELVARALARSPQDRYEVADEMLTDLLHLRDTARRAARSLSLAPPPPLAAQSPRARLRPAVTASIAAIAALGVGVAIGAIVAPRVARADTFDAERCHVHTGASTRTFVVICDDSRANDR